MTGLGLLPTGDGRVYGIHFIELTGINVAFILAEMSAEDRTQVVERFGDKESSLIWAHTVVLVAIEVLAAWR